MRFFSLSKQLGIMAHGFGVTELTADKLERVKRNSNFGKVSLNSLYECVFSMGLTTSVSRLVKMISSFSNQFLLLTTLSKKTIVQIKKNI